MTNLVLTVDRLYKNSGKAISWWQVEAIQTDEGAHLRISHAKSEAGAVVEKITPVKGKNLGKANETSPAIQAISEAKSRVAKQLDIGYVKTVEEAGVPKTNSLGLPMPMLCKTLDDVGEANIDWENAFIQPKLDGHRCLNKGIIYSRKGKEQNVAHIKEALTAHPALAELHLDGELYIHGGWSLQKLGSLITKPQPDSLKLEYWVYDMVSDQPFEQRYQAVQRAFEAATGHDVRLKLTPCFRVRSMAEARTYHHEFIAQGFEGSVIHHGLTGYEDGKRSRHSVKLKDFTDSEYPVIGYELGTPNIVKGETLQVPIFIYEVKPGLTAKVLAMGTAEEKHAEYLELIAGKNTDRRMLTIEHMGFTDDGVPNIATAKCWREDV